MKRIIIVAAVVVVAVAVVFLLAADRDERQIRKNLRGLGKTVSRTADTSDLALIGKIGRIKSLFTKDCRITMSPPVPEINSIDILVAVFGQAMHTIDELKVTFHDVSVAIDEKRTEADTFMTARTVRSSGGRRETDAREMKMRWKKIEGVWQIAEIEEIRTLH